MHIMRNDRPSFCHQCALYHPTTTKSHFKSAIQSDFKRGALTIRLGVLDGAALSLCMGAGGLAGVQPVGLRLGGLPAAEIYRQGVGMTTRLTKHEQNN